MFTWSTNKDRACVLLAEDNLWIPQIAKELGVNESTVDAWKKIPEFAARLAEYSAAFAAQMLQGRLARKQNRLAALMDLADRQQQVIAGMAASKEMKDAPGGASGLVTVTFKVLDFGDEPKKVGRPSKAAKAKAEKDRQFGRKLVKEYEFNGVLSRERRGTLEHIARELGEWEEKSTVKVSGELSIAEVLRDRRHRREAAEAEAAKAPALAATQ
jgi:hypothetical protein